MNKNEGVSFYWMQARGVQGYFCVCCKVSTGFLYVIYLETWSTRAYWIPYLIQLAVFIRTIKLNDTT